MSKGIQQEIVVRFPKPKILLVDCPPQATERLTSRGYNAIAGSFGRPYSVKQEGKYVPVVVDADLPNYHEQEIVVIDLSFGAPQGNPVGQKKLPGGVRGYWASASEGLIDPRPFAMAEVRDSFDRALRNGGIFVVFCESREKQELCIGRVIHMGMFQTILTSSITTTGHFCRFCMLQ